MLIPIPLLDRRVGFPTQVNKDHAKTVLQFVLFQIAWFVCVVGGIELALPFMIAYLIVHHVVFVNDHREWWFIAMVVCIGAGVDTVLFKLGLIETTIESSLPLPAWLLCLWCAFATTFCHSFRWLQHRIPLAAMAAAVSGPLSYWGGSRLSELQLHPVRFDEPVWLTLFVLAVVWMLSFPFYLFIARRINRTPH